MTEPVDLTNLHEMTDGDVALEQALFQEFFVAGDQILQTLETHCVDGASESWRTAAHALKGMAYNLGAQSLGNFCKQAQDCAESSLPEKQAILKAIQLSYAEVRVFLESCMLASQ